MTRSESSLFTFKESDWLVGSSQCTRTQGQDRKINTHTPIMSSAHSSWSQWFYVNTVFDSRDFWELQFKVVCTLLSVTCLKLLSFTATPGRGQRAEQHVNDSSETNLKFLKQLRLYWQWRPSGRAQRCGAECLCLCLGLVSTEPPLLWMDATINTDFIFTGQSSQ